MDSTTSHTLTWEDFSKVDMRVGTIIDAAVFDEARKPAYKVKIDFGSEIGVKKSSAQITNFYNPEVLIGMQVIAVINFPKKQIATIQSECLILGSLDKENNVILIQPQQQVENGQRIG